MPQDKAPLSDVLHVTDREFSERQRQQMKEKLEMEKLLKAASSSTSDEK